MNSDVISKLIIWAGPLYVTVLAGCLLSMGFLPPPGPSVAADQIAAHYMDHRLAILLGSSVAIQCTFLGLVWLAGVSLNMLRIQTGSIRLLALGQLIAGIFTFSLFIFSNLSWAAAAFRPERAPETIALLNDLGWIVAFIGIGGPFIQGLMLGVAILSDRAPQPVYPRWAGYFNYWYALLVLPGALLTLFHTGPLAWNGILVFWLGLVAFGTWIWVMSLLTLKSLT